MIVLSRCKSTWKLTTLSNTTTTASCNQPHWASNTLSDPRACCWWSVQERNQCFWRMSWASSARQRLAMPIGRALWSRPGSRGREGCWRAGLMLSEVRITVPFNWNTSLILTYCCNCSHKAKLLKNLAAIDCIAVMYWQILYTSKTCDTIVWERNKIYMLFTVYYYSIFNWTSMWKLVSLQ